MRDSRVKSEACRTLGNEDAMNNVVSGKLRVGSLPILGALMLVTLGCQQAATSQAEEITKNSRSKGMAVIELFTSQGCSSCPSADRNLARIVESAERDGRPVYALSFHVDYWNSLGWRDPFSAEEFTQRQREYARKFQARSVYTPQMVVNGQVHFVGSRAAD